MVEICTLFGEGSVEKGGRNRLHRG